MLEYEYNYTNMIMIADQNQNLVSKEILLQNNPYEAKLAL